ncbi:MAG: DUF3879 family protein, partial [Dorea sp.]|nr:DUF3879 family protein [Dorea sp.]
TVTESAHFKVCLRQRGGFPAAPIHWLLTAQQVRGCRLNCYGDTTKRTEVFTRYQLSVNKPDRLSGTWTLGQYERMYTKAFYEAVKEANPNWQLGQPFDTSIVRNITREDVENRIVKGSSEFALKPRPSLDIKV